MLQVLYNEWSKNVKTSFMLQVLYNEWSTNVKNIFHAASIIQRMKYKC